MTRLPASIALLVLAGCASSPPVAAPAPPPFVQSLIAGFEAAPVANPPASVWRYTYRDATVYYVPPRCCDLPGVVYDGAGEAVCQPDGGYTGRGDGRCPDFVDRRRDGVLVWADPRGERG